MTDSKGKVTKEEIEAFAAKLETWGDGLSEREQKFLGYLVHKASVVDEDDVATFSFTGLSLKSLISTALSLKSGGIF